VKKLVLALALALAVIGGAIADSSQDSNPALACETSCG